MMQDLARYWARGYDWRRCEQGSQRPAALHHRDRRPRNPLHSRALAARRRVADRHQSRVAGLDHRAAETHRSPRRSSTTWGGSAADAFHVVIPSMPAYGFSGKPTTTGWGPERMAGAWAKLMSRLGYTRYVAQGGDWGAFVVDQMGRQAPEGPVGVCCIGRGRDRAGWADVSPSRCRGSSAVGLRWFPVPSGRDLGRGPIVPALRAVVPRRGGSAGRAWCRGRPPDRVPLGAVVHARFLDAARLPPSLPGDRWFVDETYVKVNGGWRYLYRAVDQYGQVIDVLFRQRDRAANPPVLRAGTKAGRGRPRCHGPGGRPTQGSSTS